MTKSYDFTTRKKPRPVTGLFLCNGFCGLRARGAKHSQKSKDVAVGMQVGALEVDRIAIVLGPEQRWSEGEKKCKQGSHEMS